jgi:FixJ family two-component response regulator
VLHFSFCYRLAGKERNDGKPVTVIIVDDDPSFDLLARLVSTVGLKSVSFTSAEEFRDTTAGRAGVRVLDVQKQV